MEPEVLADSSQPPILVAAYERDRRAHQYQEGFQAEAEVHQGTGHQGSDSEAWLPLGIDSSHQN